MCARLWVQEWEESYDLLRSSFADGFKTINGIIKTGKVCVNGLDAPVEFSLGGDYKVIISLSVGVIHTRK